MCKKCFSFCSNPTSYCSENGPTTSRALTLGINNINIPNRSNEIQLIQRIQDSFQWMNTAARHNYWVDVDLMLSTVYNTGCRIGLWCYKCVFLTTHWSMQVQSWTSFRSVDTLLILYGEAVLCGNYQQGWNVSSTNRRARPRLPAVK